MKVKLVLKRYGPVAAQLVHFVLALGMLGAAIAEYAANPPVFDVVGRHRNRGGLPDGIFRVRLAARLVGVRDGFHRQYSRSGSVW